MQHLYRLNIIISGVHNDVILLRSQRNLM